jgi:hypothetical protein
MLDDDVRVGIQALLDDYAEVAAGDFAIVLYTPDSRASAAGVVAALRMRHVPVASMWMKPLHDVGFQTRVAAILPPSSAVPGRLLIFTFEQFTMSHMQELSAALYDYDGPHGTYRSISACADLFSSALRVSPAELSARNTALLERFMQADRLHIKTRGGSDLWVGLDNRRHRWISNRGTPGPTGLVMLPAGEVATFPADIDGVLVADFAFNINAITDRDSRLVDHPVTVHVEDGRAKGFECADERVSRFLDEVFRTHCAYNVGELGFGTNSRIGDPIAMNSHINERRVGVHVGFGQHNQQADVVDYQCLIHLDLIARGGMVWVDGDPSPVDLENVIPSSGLHPGSVRHEDIFSPDVDDLDIDDCCGILTGEGLRLFELRTEGRSNECASHSPD